MERSYNRTIDIDRMASMLRGEIRVLLEVQQYLENGNPLTSYVDENIKQVEKELRQLRTSFINN